MQSSGAECVAVETDITDAARAEQLVRTVVDRFGRLDVVVNNVGDFRWGALAESSLEDWQSIFSSNLLTVLYVSRAALPHMRRGRWGRIINLGAVGAERAFGQAKISAYAAAKAAVVALSGLVKLTVPGPLILDQLIEALLPRGQPSSATVPLRAAFDGKVMLWSAPALTTGAWFSGSTTMTRSSLVASCESLAVKRST